MSVRINIPHEWRHHTKDHTIVEVRGDTVGQCLNDLVRQFPRIELGLFDKDGKLQNYVSIYINRESSYPEVMTTPVKDGDEIDMVIMIGGG